MKSVAVVLALAFAGGADATSCTIVDPTALMGVITDASPAGTNIGCTGVTLAHDATCNYDLSPGYTWAVDTGTLVNACPSSGTTDLSTTASIVSANGCAANYLQTSTDIVAGVCTGCPAGYTRDAKVFSDRATASSGAAVCNLAADGGGCAANYKQTSGAIATVTTGVCAACADGDVLPAAVFGAAATVCAECSVLTTCTNGCPGTAWQSGGAATCREKTVAEGRVSTTSVAADVILCTAAGVSLIDGGAACAAIQITATGSSACTFVPVTGADVVCTACDLTAYTGTDAGKPVLGVATTAYTVQTATAAASCGVKGCRANYYQTSGGLVAVGDCIEKAVKAKACTAIDAMDTVQCKAGDASEAACLLVKTQKADGTGASTTAACTFTAAVATVSADATTCDAVSSVATSAACDTAGAKCKYVAPIVAADAVCAPCGPGTVGLVKQTGAANNAPTCTPCNPLVAGQCVTGCPANYYQKVGTTAATIQCLACPTGKVLANAGVLAAVQVEAACTTPAATAAAAASSAASSTVSVATAVAAAVAAAAALV